MRGIGRLRDRIWQWLTTHDRGLLALRRAGRAAIAMPILFAFCAKVLHNGDIATYAAFGSFAMLMLVDFGGSIRDRLRAQLTLAVASAVLVALGTLASREEWLAAVAMTVVGFGALFVGVVSSVLAGATTALLLSFILPVSLASKPGVIPDRLAGWGIATAAALLAVSLLWPAPASDPLRGRAAAACRAIATRLHLAVSLHKSGVDVASAPEYRAAVTASATAMADLNRVFLATPNRPTGLSTSARAVVRLVDELSWLSAILAQSRSLNCNIPNPAACKVKSAAASVLEQGADLLDEPGASLDGLHDALTALREALTELERDAIGQLPMQSTAFDDATISAAELRHAESVMLDERVSEVIDALDPSFRAQEISFVASLIGRNIDLAARAERRPWVDRLLGRQPEGLPGTFTAAQERAAAHVERHSVWLHNSVRGAVGLGLAVLVANLTGVQHSFWVVLGTLSVLRSSALNTGLNAFRAVLGTTAGFVIGALLLIPIGHSTGLLWFLLPPAIVLAGIAPAAISFAAGQAGFTLVLVILFNIIQPTGWRVGLLRVEDIAIGAGVSLAVGILFWPRGAAAALSKALSEAYADSARYLAAAVEYGMLRFDIAGTNSTGGSASVDAASLVPTQQAIRAAAAARRMDDTFREYLVERGAKTVPLAEITRLVSGVTGLRLAADAVLDLWQRDEEPVSSDRAAARMELLRSVEHLRNWYDDLAGSLDGARTIPPTLDRDPEADNRLVLAVQHDLRDEDGKATATAVRMIWTGDHLDAVRRLQPSLLQPALAARSAAFR
ncbi:MAG TPA: FUSC family protein [Actinocrinis sp.]|nr:FUSC family protein [Actinocrinis sp.]